MTAPLPEVTEWGVECYRVGRHPDPLAHAPHHAQPWDGRYDDPDRVSRTLYFADSAYGAWVEVLARFRPEPGLRDALERIIGEDDDPPGPSFGVELRWLATRAPRPHRPDLGRRRVCGPRCPQQTTCRAACPASARARTALARPATGSWCGTVPAGFVVFAGPGGA